MDFTWLEVTTLAERPDRMPMTTAFDDPGVAQFLYQDPISAALFPSLVARYPRYTLLAVERSTGRPAALLCTLPFTATAAPPAAADDGRRRDGGSREPRADNATATAAPAAAPAQAGDDRLSPAGDDGLPPAGDNGLPPAGDDGLPPAGYDAVLLSAATNALAGAAGPDVSALFATVRPDLRGQSVSAHLLSLARQNATELGHPALFAPVRPTRKHLHPLMPLAEYVARRRPDGTAEDPWLRVHERAGGRFVKVAPHSMTITATLDRWREWTGLPFDAPGPVLVAGGLSPVLSDPERGIATYIEANAWFRHDLRAERPADPARTRRPEAPPPDK